MGSIPRHPPPLHTFWRFSTRPDARFLWLLAQIKPSVFERRGRPPRPSDHGSSSRAGPAPLPGRHLLVAWAMAAEIEDLAGKAADGMSLQRRALQKPAKGSPLLASIWPAPLGLAKGSGVGSCEAAGLGHRLPPPQHRRWA